MRADRVNSTISVRLLSKDEYRSARFRRSDISENTRLSLQWVSLRNTVRLSAWRTPDTHDVVCPMVERHRNSESRNHVNFVDVITTVSSWGATPCQIGGYFHVPMSQSRETGENAGLICRLMLDATSVDQRSFRKKFALFSDFKSLFSFPFELRQNYCMLQSTGGVWAR